MALVYLVWLCVCDPQVTFLHNGRSSEWIVFPSSPSATSHRIVEMDVVFQRSFTLDELPQIAQLRLCACKRAELVINGNRIEPGTKRNWKEVSRINVAASLRPGTNTITVRVFNDNGPPALWLVLNADRLTLRSDETWEASFAGSSWRSAALASTPRLPRAGNLMAGGEKTLSSLKSAWPLWATFAGAAIVLLIGGQWWLLWMSPPDARVGMGPLQRAEIVPLILVATLWMMLFSNNVNLLPYKVGFDSASHIDYISYIQERGSLPWPEEGFEMFQPPLYYGASAGMLWVSGLSAQDADSGVALRCFTVLCGIAHLLLVFLSLRLLFPEKFSKQLVGLVLAAFLPMNLYLSQYVTNETLMALLVSAAVYFCLRILRAGTNSWMSSIALGLILGAAVLTKFTAVVAIPFITVALAWRSLTRGEPARVWLKNVGLVLLTVTLVSGWHYVRIWEHTGRLVIGGWDPACKFDWWQEDGYRTAAFFLRFGESLIRPLFSGAASFGDGIYSTMWGDGLCSGALGPIFRLPWNYDLMCAGYLLALVPAALILIGAIVSAVKLVRKGGLDLFVLLGLAFAMTVALISVNLKVPYYASVKAFYGLCALVPLSFFCAVGWDAITRGRKFLQLTLSMVLLVWAMNNFASLWIRGDSAPAQMCRGFAFAGEGLIEAAASEFGKAVHVEPQNARAHRWLAWALIQIDRADEALRAAESAARLSPSDADCHLQLATVFWQLGNVERAIAEARRAVELGPDCADACRYLSAWLEASGRYDDAINVARDGLAVSPYDSDMRYQLGMALMKNGDIAGATTQLDYGSSLKP